MSLTSYQRRLIAFLSVATFFEGYDFLAMTQLLPSLRTEFGLSKTDAGLMVAVINAGTIIAALLVRKADAWGRRRVLTITIAGYTICSLLTAASPNVVVFALAQMAGRVFLIGEWATAMVIAAEEYPAERRGVVIGVVQACSSLGSIVCAGLVPLLISTALGWRLVYLVGAIPLVIIAFARRGLRETERFTRQAATGAPRPFMRIWSLPSYRRRMLKLAAIWGVTYIATQNAVVFWKEFAVHERGWSDGQVGLAMASAAVGSMPLVFLAGPLLDWLGRRRGAVIIFGGAAAGVALSFTLTSHLGLTVALALGMFGISAVLPVMNAYNSELFPTDLRGDAFAWSNNILGRVTYVLSPLLIGALAETRGWGPVLAWTAVCPVVALGLIWAFMPETRGRELEETSAA